jgi:hypothetical protein
VTQSAGEGPPGASSPAGPGSKIERAFGVDNRRRLLANYFGSRELQPSAAWRDVYRLLLWTDRTTGLAHCYESDKSQPGRPWYARSLAFHDWLAAALSVEPRAVADEIDLLFRWASRDMAAAAAGRRESLAATARLQRLQYASRDFPLPGEDPELNELVADVLGPYLAEAPPPEVLRALAERIRIHVGQENKRKNLVGEGFEDTVGELLRRTAGVSSRYEVMVRPLLHQLPGFHPPRGTEKPRQVDLALVDSVSGRRILVSCKWSVRSDREEQFSSDFRSYSELEAAGQDFGYVLVTNEFDPARLAAACENRRQNALLFSDVVHVNPSGPHAAYESDRALREGGGIARAIGHIESGRLTPLGGWLETLAGN